MEYQLLLIFGLPRSGTTWIAKIFDSHPATLYRHEPDSGGRLPSIPLVTQVVGAKPLAPIIKNFVAALPELSSPRTAGSLPMFPKNYQSSANLLMKKFTVLVSKASEPFIGEIPLREAIDHQKAERICLVWKSVESLGRLDVIMHAEPESRAVVILRHPCGYIASVVAGQNLGQFSSSVASSDDYTVFDQLLRRSPRTTRNPTLQDLKRLTPVERLAWRWLLFNEIAFEQNEASDRRLFVRYEDICSRPVNEARNLLRFAGLEWHAQVERFIERSISRSSDRYYSIFKKPEESASKWERQLTHPEVEAVGAVIQQSCLREVYPDLNRSGRKAIFV